MKRLNSAIEFLPKIISSICNTNPYGLTQCRYPRAALNKSQSNQIKAKPAKGLKISSSCSKATIWGAYLQAPTSFNFGNLSPVINRSHDFDRANSFTPLWVVALLQSPSAVISFYNAIAVCLALLL
jgi:hypothetical protein